LLLKVIPNDPGEDWFKMTKYSRREFLFTLAAGMGAVAVNKFLAACSRTDIKADPTLPQAPIATSEAIDESDSGASVPDSNPAPIETAMGTPDMVVTRGAEGNDVLPEDLVRRALAGLGGMERFVAQGANVIVKPNICLGYHSYEFAATTNPWVVGALVKLCIEAGAGSVHVMDYPFGGPPEQAYAKSGIEEQVRAAGGEMVTMPRFKFVPTEIPQAVDMDRCDIFDDVLNTDVLINVPIAKHHSLARLTLGMKNLMGVIYDRPSIHRNIGQRLADLTSRVYPTLTVVDAVRILVANGPTGGNLDDVRKIDTVIASPDIVAADSYASTLFGLRPDELAYVQAGTAMGLGRSDLENLVIEEIAVGS
jgi:uncharacterized protein (DUF362 family)